MKQIKSKIDAQKFVINNADKALNKALKSLGWKISEIHLKPFKEIQILEKRLSWAFSVMEMPSLDFQSVTTKKGIRIGGNYSGMISSMIRHYTSNQWFSITEEEFRKLLRKRTNKVYKNDMYGFVQESSKDEIKETVFGESYKNVGIGSCASVIYKSVTPKADKAGNILVSRSVLVYD